MQAINRVSMAASLLRLIVYGVCVLDAAMLYRATLDRRLPDIDPAKPACWLLLAGPVALAAPAASPGMRRATMAASWAWA